jgi:chromosome segregation ATPase
MWYVLMYLLFQSGKGNSAVSEALEQQLLQERRLAEELQTKQRAITAQLEELRQRETEARAEVTNFEKTVTILKHDLKEVQ